MKTAMDLLVALNQNIKFLLVEVGKQVARTGAYLQKPTSELAEKIHTSDDVKKRFFTTQLGLL